MKKTKLNLYGVALAGLVLGGANRTLAADLYVPTDHPTIQAAVDTADSGDIIHIAPGVYTAQTLINGKSLTLIGQPGTILRAFPNMEALVSGSEWRCVLLISSSSDVAIKGLTFEGDQLADQNLPGLIGVYLLDSGGSVENCRFTGFRERIPGSNPAVAIQVYNDLPGASLLNVSVVGNTIVDSYSGMEIRGAPDVTSLNFTVADNTMSGVGPSSTVDPLTGINLQQGTVGNVTRNTISGFSYIGDGVNRSGRRAFGILRISLPIKAPLEPVTFEGNVLRNNQVHFGMFLGDDSVVTHNSFEGTASGIDPIGLWFSGENVQDIAIPHSSIHEGNWVCIARWISYCRCHGNCHKCRTGSGRAEPSKNNMFTPLPCRFITK
jgi:Right handed beta helix region